MFSLKFPNYYREFVLVTIIAIFLFHSELYKRNHIVQELGLNSHEILKLREFESESHTVVTADGYQLELIRILNPDLYEIQNQFKPILLLHGFQGSSNVWLVSGNETLKDHNENIPNSLGIALAKEHYDVWLGNVRGNIFSRQHTDFHTKSVEFWNFNIDDIIRFDLPAMIDYVRNTTGYSEIGYIGHSQANLMLFSLMSVQPRFNNHIKPFIALAPTVFTTKFSAPMALSPWKKNLLFSFYTKDFMTEFLRIFRIPYFCASGIIPEYFCYKILYKFVGSCEQQLDWRRLPVYLDNLFFGCASKQYEHRLQMIQRGQPAYYNYSTNDENISVYGTQISPLYDVSNVNNSFMAFIYTDSDWFNHLDDVSLLRQHLKVKLFDDYQIPVSGWNHADLLWAKDAGKFVNSRILEILRRTYHQN